MPAVWRGLALARYFKQQAKTAPLDRSVLFSAFTAEETGLIERSILLSIRVCQRKTSSPFKYRWHECEQGRGLHFTLWRRRV